MSGSRLLLARATLAARSCQSDRFTNSNVASPTSANWLEDTARCVRARVGEDEAGNSRSSSGSPCSMAGDDADCLNSCSESATLRPMPALLWDGERCWAGDVSDDESEDDESTDAFEFRRERLRGEVTVGNVDDEGSVSARTGRKREDRLREGDGSASARAVVHCDGIYREIHKETYAAR